MNFQSEYLSMKTLGVIIEERFIKTLSGDIFSPSGFGDDFWRRYLSVFDRVVVIARLNLVDQPDSKWSKITDSRVSISGISYYLGPKEFIAKLPSVYRDFRANCNLVNAFVVRAPGTLSLLALRLIANGKVSSKPFAVELVGDPVDVFSSGIGGIFGVVYKYIFKFSTRRLCSRASAVSYVTKEVLQKRYPANSGAITIACSSIDLPREFMAKEPRRDFSFIRENRPPLAFVAASLAAPYKGIDVLLHAIEKLKSVGFLVRLEVAGDGRLEENYKTLAKRLNIGDQISFLGRLARSDVLQKMRETDIYIQPSLTEGLPRAVIEACATAAPVVASRVGGIPELLDADDMVSPGDAGELAERIMKTLTNPARMAAMSARNYATALEYDSSVLDARRQTFYAELRRLVCNEGDN